MPPLLLTCALALKRRFVYNKHARAQRPRFTRASDRVGAFTLFDFSLSLSEGDSLFEGRYILTQGTPCFSVR